MDENLLGYLLNNLDQATHERVENQLRTDPVAQQRLELLRQALAPLEEDRDIQPPADLTIKTLARVAEHCCKELPRSPQPAPPSLPASAPFWRRVDVLVAAGLLLAVVSLSVPQISRWRQSAAILACQDNLKKYYFALEDYRARHNKLPNFADIDPPRNVAGMIAPILNEAGVLDNASVCCPANKGPVPCSVTFAYLSSLSAKDFQKQAPELLPTYAFSLGFRDENGTYHCAMEPQPDIPSQRVPLMADGPPVDVADMRNSVNHGGYGQNVLFNDGHVEFVSNRKVGVDEDIYLNVYRKVAAGIGSKDTVLGSSAAHP